MMHLCIILKIIYSNTNKNTAVTDFSSNLQPNHIYSIFNQISALYSYIISAFGYSHIKVKYLNINI